MLLKHDKNKVGKRIESAMFERQEIENNELKALAETAGELVCVLKESVDATAASKPAVGIFAGDVNSTKLIFGGGQT